MTEYTQLTITEVDNTLKKIIAHVPDLALSIADNDRNKASELIKWFITSITDSDAVEPDFNKDNETTFVMLKIKLNEFRHYWQLLLEMVPTDRLYDYQYQIALLK